MSFKHVFLLFNEYIHKKEIHAIHVTNLLLFLCLTCFNLGILIIPYEIVLNDILLYIRCII